MDHRRPASALAIPHRHGPALSRRRFLQAATATGIIAGTGPTLWIRPGSAAEPPLAPRVMFGADPTRQMVVSWSTSAAVDAPFVDIGVDDSFGLRPAVESKAVAGTDTVYHHAVLDSLDPDTVYRYRVGHVGAVGDVHDLTTAPAAAAPFTFTAFGDQGVNDNATIVNGVLAAQDPAFHVHVGDICYAYNAGTGDVGSVNPVLWDQWLDQMSPVGATVPWMVGVGNHEMEVGYGDLGYDGVLARFTLPDSGATDSTYVFRYGNVAVLQLDANEVSYEITHNNDYSNGAQLAWLDQTLGALRADPTIDWIVCGYHHCSYCTNALHGSDGGVRDEWHPLFDQHEVDIVVNGHNHSYERSHQMRGGVIAGEAANGGSADSAVGTTYITAGASGNIRLEESLSPVSYFTDSNGLRIPETAEWSASHYLDLSLVAFDVTPPDESGVTTLAIRGLDATAATIDAFTLRRTRPATAVLTDTAVRTPDPVPAAAPAVSGPALPATGAEVPLAVGAAAVAAAGALRRVATTDG